MTTLTEGRHDGEFILSEAEAGRARDTVVVAAGSGIIEPGTVLGEITASGKYVPSPAAAVVGSEGAEDAVAIAIGRCDATSADAKVAVISRAAQAKGAALVYDASVNNPTKIAAKAAQLAAAGIIVR